MSAGHDPKDWATADHAEITRLMANKAVKAELSRVRRKNDEYDLPYLAGYSQDGSTIYFDRHLPERLKVGNKYFNPRAFVEIHEEWEKSLIDALGMPYLKAHPVGNAMEKRAVVAAGIPWTGYAKVLEPYIKADDHEKLIKIPPDLDWSPYFAPPVDRKLIARMREAEDEEKLAKSDPTVQYSDDRGTLGRHCGPDKDWPKNYCKMYGHFSCSEVAGYISPKGGCDLYVRARD